MNQRSVVRRRSNKEPVPAAWDSSNHESFFSQTQRENSFFDRSDSPESQRSFFTLREQEEPYPIALDEKSSRSFFKSTHYDEPFSRSPIEQGSFFTQGKQEVSFRMCWDGDGIFSPFFHSLFLIYRLSSII